MGGIQQQPWTPTKRRGPIAAEYSSPGPACVTLPNLIGESLLHQSLADHTFVQPVSAAVPLPDDKSDIALQIYHDSDSGLRH
jgi:hypothetical protein